MKAPHLHLRPEILAGRPTLTNKGRAALGLPPIADEQVLVPVLNYPAREDRPRVKAAS